MNYQTLRGSGSTSLPKKRSGDRSARRLSMIALFCTLILTCLSFSADATHYRYGNISYTWVSGRTVTLKVAQSYRRTFYPGPPNVGSTVNVGTLQFGDGTTSPINVVVTSVNIAEDWFYGEANITHTYLGTATAFTTFYQSNARLSSLENNADAQYRSEARVILNNQNGPASTMPPIVNVPVGQTAATFQISGTGSSALTYRFATSAEMGGGSPAQTQPAGMSVNTSGLVTFNTVGKVINDLYNAAFVITDAAGASTMVDVLVKIVQQSTPPSFDYALTPANNTVYNIQPGQNVSFPVKAIDIDPGNTVSLNAVGIPPGATVSPALPITGNGNPGVTTNFSWTPTNAQLGTRVVTFVAQDNLGNQTTSSVTIITSLDPVFDVPPTLAAGSFNCLQTGTLFTTPIQAHAPDPLVTLNISAATTMSGVTYTPSVPTTFANTRSTTLNWTPTPSQWGVHAFTFTATDNTNHSTNHSYDLVVNTSPSFVSSQPDVTITVNEPFTYNIVASDPDVPFGDELEILSPNMPAWLTITQTGPTTATISGTPGPGDLGHHHIHVEVEDIHHHCGPHIDQEFEIEVEPCTFGASITSSSSGSDCPGTTVTLTANMADSYQWSTGETTQSIDVVAGGTASYSVTSVLGYCSASATETVTANDSQAPVLVGIPADATASCDAVPAPANVTATDNCGAATVASFSYPTVNAKNMHIWKGENNMNDEFGTANAATQFGSVNYGTGISGNSFSFDGSTGLTAGIEGGIFGTVDFSVSAWVKTTSNGGMTVIQQRDLDIDGQYILKVGTNHNGGTYAPGQVYFLVGGAPGFSEIFSTITVNDGQWHHVAGERTGSTISIYIDGVLNTSTSTPGTIYMNANGTTATSIGYDKRNVDFGVDPNFFFGDIDEVRVMYGANCPANHDVNYVWTATDASNNTATGTQTVSISDNDGPAITTPADITVSNDAGVCGATVNFSASATDVCSSITNITYSQASGTVFSDGTTMVNITATDACGNASNASFNVTVLDNQIPTFSFFPADVTVSANAGSCEATNVSIGTATATDNCAVTVTNNAPATYPIGATYIVWTATDATGNMTSNTQVVTVTDDEEPTVAAPAAVSVSADAGQCSASNVTLGSATFGDNCTGASVSNDAPATFPIGQTTVTYTATDASGNTATATQVVTVTDDENPTVAAPAAVSVSADAGQCSASNVALGSAIFGDNCTGAIVSNNAPTTFPVGQTTVTYTATDASGNTATAIQLVTVTDNQNPTVTAPAAIQVNANAGQCAATNVTLGNANAADNCGTVTITNNAPSSYPVGQTTVTYTATDGHGNTATATQVVTVIDNQDPSITAPANVTKPGWCMNVPANNVTLGTPTTSDNCAVATVTNNAPASYPVGTTTVTWTVTDVNGNTNTATQTVTVTPLTLTATASVSPAYPFPGQELQTIYLGYPSSAQSVTISAAGTNGTAPYTYAWQRSGCNNTTLAPLSNTAATYSFAPTQANICKADSDNVYKFVITVTDAHGCATIQQRNINVVDPYVGNKIKICHRPPGYPENSHILTVGAGAIPAHLDHGDNLGNCYNFNGKSIETEEEQQEQALQTIAENLKFNVYPNPTTGTVIVELPKTGTVSVMIVDVSGKVVVREVIKDNTQQQLQYNLSDKAKGMYFINVVNAGESFQEKLILQ